MESGILCSFHLIVIYDVIIIINKLSFIIIVIIIIIVGIMETRNIQMFRIRDAALNLTNLNKYIFKDSIYYFCFLAYYVFGYL